MLFEDRLDAGSRLGKALLHFRGSEAPLVLALPRGGVPVAAEAARALDAPLDLCFAHKIGAPDNPEFAIGAVSEAGAPFIREEIVQSLRIPYARVLEEAAFQQAELARKARAYRGQRQPPDIEGKRIILIDDGAATGATALAALRALRARKPASLIFAAPVASAEAAQLLAAEAGELVILRTPALFGAVADYYRHFEQVSDAGVIALLGQFSHK